MMSVGASMAAVAMARMPNEDLARKAALALILCEPKQYGDTVLRCWRMRRCVSPTMTASMAVRPKTARSKLMLSLHD